MSILRSFVQWLRVGKDGKSERIFPCRCGEVHDGDYGMYDYGHHNCFHEGTLGRLDADDSTCVQVMCYQCGNVWDIEPSTHFQERERIRDKCVGRVHAFTHKQDICQCGNWRQLDIENEWSSTVREPETRLARIEKENPCTKTE